MPVGAKPAETLGRRDRLVAPDLSLGWPVLETPVLFCGGIGSFIPELEWVQTSPLAAAATAVPRHPRLYATGFILLGVSFIMHPVVLRRGRSRLGSFSGFALN